MGPRPNLLNPVPQGPLSECLAPMSRCELPKPHLWATASAPALSPAYLPTAPEDKPVLVSQKPSPLTLGLPQLFSDELLKEGQWSQGTPP